MPRGGRSLALKSRLSRPSATPPGGGGISRAWAAPSPNFAHFFRLCDSSASAGRDTTGVCPGRLGRASGWLPSEAPHAWWRTRFCHKVVETVQNRTARLIRSRDKAPRTHPAGQTEMATQAVRGRLRPSRRLLGQASSEPSWKDSSRRIRGGRGWARENVLAQARAVLEAATGISLCRRNRRGGLPG